MANNIVTKSIGAQNIFSDVLKVGRNRKVNFSLSGTFVATVVLQRKPLGALDAAYVDIGSYTAPTEKVVDSYGQWEYRAGVKTGGYTSGTAVITLLV